MATINFQTMNWHDKNHVIAYANALGAGTTVFKVPGRINFNITHTSRTDRYKPEWVVYQTFSSKGK